MAAVLVTCLPSWWFHTGDENIDLAIDLALSLLVIIACMPIIWLLWKRRVAALRDELLARNIRPAVCLRCSYDLRGSEAATCPECGVTLVREAVSETDTPQN